MARSKADAGNGVSKMEMVRQALNELGSASPKEIQAFVSEKHGANISPTMISSYKSQILRKQGGGRGGSGGEASVAVKDVETLRRLIDKVGASQLQALIKVLAK